MIESLFLNGKQIDLGNSSVTLNFESNMFSDVSAITSSYSQTIKIPKTLRNMAVLENADVINIATETPYTLFDCSYQRDGVELVSGKAAVKASNDNCYNLALVWGCGIAIKEFVENTGGVTLRDIPITYTDRPKLSLLQVGNTGLSTLNARGYGYADYNSNYPGSATLPKNIPSCTINWLKTKVESYTGVTFDFKDISFDNEVIALSELNGDEYSYKPVKLGVGITPINVSDLYEGESLEDRIYVGQVASYKFNLSILSSYSGDTSIFTKVTSGSTFISDGIKSSRPCKLSGKMKLYINQTTEKIKFVLLRQSADSNESNELYTRISELETVNGRTVQVLDIDFSGMAIDANDTVRIAITGDGLGVQNVLANKFVNGLFFLNGSGNEVYMWDGYRYTANDGTVYNMYEYHYDNTGTPVTESLTDTTIEKLQPIPSANLINGESYPIVANLPDISIIEFIKECCWRKGAFPLIVDGNTIKFYNVDVFSKRIAGNDVYDWSKNVIFDSSRWQSEYVISGYARNNYLRHAEYDGYEGQHDGNLRVYDESLDLSRDMAQSSFVAINGSNYPIYKQDEAGEYDLNDIAPAWGAITKRADSSNAVFSMTSNNIFKSLISDVWGEFQQMINQPRIKTLPIRLSHFDLQTLDFSRPVYIQEFNSYFAIISVQSSSEVCTVKLIKL